MNLNNESLITIVGGSLTASYLNALSRAVSTLLNLGQVLGTTVRRFFSNSICK